MERDRFQTGAPQSRRVLKFNRYGGVHLESLCVERGFAYSETMGLPSEIAPDYYIDANEVAFVRGFDTDTAEGDDAVVIDPTKIYAFMIFPKKSACSGDRFGAPWGISTPGSGLLFQVEPQPIVVAGGFRFISGQQALNLHSNTALAAKQTVIEFINFVGFCDLYRCNESPFSLGTAPQKYYFPLENVAAVLRISNDLQV
jgi:hypothetical protein